MTLQPTPADYATAEAIMQYLETSEVKLVPTRGSLAHIIAAHHAPIDPVQAHAQELEIALRHIWEMADEELRTVAVEGRSAIRQIEADARALLDMLERERNATVDNAAG